MSAPVEKLVRELRPFIPGEIDDYPFTLLEFRLYIRVARRGKDGCFDSLETLARAFRVTERTITRTFRVLVFCGAVGRLDHPARYEPRPFSEWMAARDLDKIREEVWGKKPRRRTRRHRVLALVPSPEIQVTSDVSGLQTNRSRCPDRPSPVSQSSRTPGSDEVDPISEGISKKGVETHTPVFEDAFKQRAQSQKRQDPRAIRLYRQICRRAPNYYQRQEITATATNTEQWEATLRQFMLEGQSPHRIDWLLERYCNAVALDSSSDYATDCSSSLVAINAQLFPRDPEQPMKTVRQRLVESGELPRIAETSQGPLVAPLKPVGYFDPQVVEPQRPLYEPSEGEPIEMLRARVFLVTEKMPPASSTYEQMREMLVSIAREAAACPA